MTDIDKKREEIRGVLGKVVDDTLVYEALVVLNLDKEKVEEMKNWSPHQINANYTLREKTIDALLTSLHSQDVVIKVDSGEHGQGVTSCAGYEIAAVEPLIKDK